MKLNKKYWKEVEVEKYVDHIEKNERNPDVRVTAKYVSVEHVRILDLNLNGFTSEEQPSFTRTFKKGQILFAKRWAISTPYPSKIAIADIDGICSPHLWALETKSGLTQNLLPFILQTNKFFDYANINSAGSLAGVYLKWESFSKYRFNLPSDEEQIELTEFFQSIDTAIEQAEQQEKKISTLRKMLSNGLVNTTPTFGNLLDKKNCTVTTFGKITDCIEQHDKEKKDVSRFIGLENIEPENLKITTWGNIADGTTFTKRFSKGDVLFGKRRAYLKKVAVADFDGICSGDILVFRAKEKMILPDLLPFYASSEAFIQHAVSTSAGSLSPRTKWRDLSLFELAIPDLITQGEIVEVFQQLQAISEQIKMQIRTLKNLKQKLLNEILG